MCWLFGSKSSREDPMQSLLFNLQAKLESQDEEIQKLKTDQEEKWRSQSAEMKKLKSTITDLKCGFEDVSLQLQKNENSIEECNQSYKKYFQFFKDQLEYLGQKTFKMHEVMDSKICDQTVQINQIFSQHQTPLNQIVNLMPMLFNKSCDLTKKQLSYLEEDIYSIKKKIFDKIDAMKEEALQSERLFEERFPALTHATQTKKESAPGNIHICCFFCQIAITHSVLMSKFPLCIFSAKSKGHVCFDFSYIDFRITNFNVNHSCFFQDFNL